MANQDEAARAMKAENLARLQGFQEAFAKAFAEDMADGTFDRESYTDPDLRSYADTLDRGTFSAEELIAPQGWDDRTKTYPIMEATDTGVIISSQAPEQGEAGYDEEIEDIRPGEPKVHKKLYSGTEPGTDNPIITPINPNSNSDHPAPGSGGWPKGVSREERDRQIAEVQAGVDVMKEAIAAEIEKQTGLRNAKSAANLDKLRGWMADITSGKIDFEQPLTPDQLDSIGTKLSQIEDDFFNQFGYVIPVEEREKRMNSGAPAP
jgi:hypothetical protein